MARCNLFDDTDAPASDGSPVAVGGDDGAPRSRRRGASRGFLPPGTAADLQALADSGDALNAAQPPSACGCGGSCGSDHGHPLLWLAAGLLVSSLIFRRDR